VSSRRPQIAEQEHHYWRRRANRRVRKRRLTRNLLQWSVILTVHLLIGGVLLYGALRGVRSLSTSSEFSLERIEVAGARRASVDGIQLALQPYLARNLFEVNLLEVGAVAQRDPWVLGTSVKRVLPGTLRVTLRERTPAALAVIGGVVHLVDSTGYVIGPSGPGLTDDMPVLTGLDRYQDEALTAALRRGVGLIERMRRSSQLFAEEISELDLARADRVLARTVHHGPALLLDPDRVERNVNPYLRLRPEIERRSGPFEYVDLRWADRISVMPVSESSAERSR
jgi:cell division protein FtsQ